MDYESKPQPAAYQRICELLEVQPEECVLVEDNLRNLHPASALGMATILVQDGSDGPRDSADVTIERIEEVGDALWRLMSTH
jgi:putative hydrolase of the HAD superfamily